jgi:hypothetical protein
MGSSACLHIVKGFYFANAILDYASISISGHPFWVSVVRADGTRALASFVPEMLEEAELVMIQIP